MNITNNFKKGVIKETLSLLLKISDKIWEEQQK